MGRLIDADVLKIRLYHNKETVINDALVKCIDETPTAYDVEAKVAELKENALTKFDWSEAIDLDEAISIVRGKE